MTEEFGAGTGGDRPEIGELLSGLDPPRALPASLRQRLEEELASSGSDPAARPLAPELTERLTVALEGGEGSEAAEDREMAMLFFGLDAPRPLPTAVVSRLSVGLGDQLAPRRRRLSEELVRRGSRTQVGAGIAAACLVVAAVTGIALSGHNTSRPAATASSTTGGGATGVGSGGATESQAFGVFGSGGTGSANAGAQAPSVARPSMQDNQVAAGMGGSTTGAGSAGGGGSGGGTGGGLPGPTSVASTTTLAALVPVVSSVTPASGPPSGFTNVTIRGLRFDNASVVDFDTSPAVSFVVVSSTEIMAITPAHLPGFVNVRVTTPHGTSAVSPNDRFQFLG